MQNAMSRYLGPYEVNFLCPQVGENETFGEAQFRFDCVGEPNESRTEWSVAPLILHVCAYFLKPREKTALGEQSCTRDRNDYLVVVALNTLMKKTGALCCQQM